MASHPRRSFLLAGGAALVAMALPAIARAQSAAAARNRAVFQITDNDPARWNMVLNNMANLREGVGSEGVEIELVAFGPGLLMLTADSSVKKRVAEALKDGVTINACQNTMKGMKFTPADMLPDIGYVPAGVVEVMKKQQQGWAYIRLLAPVRPAPPRASDRASRGRRAAARSAPRARPGRDRAPPRCSVIGRISCGFCSTMIADRPSSRTSRRSSAAAPRR